MICAPESLEEGVQNPARSAVLLILRTPERHRIRVVRRVVQVNLSFTFQLNNRTPEQLLTHAAQDR